MGGKFPSRGDFDIQAAIIDEYEWISDFFIDSLGSKCKLFFPPETSECPNCYYDTFNERSSGVYKQGGPKPFPNGTICPWCGGTGTSKLSKSKEIKLRVYWGKDKFKYITNMDVGNDETVAVIIGYLTDMADVQRADKILVDSDKGEMFRWLAKLEGDPQPHGLKKRRYFIAKIRRIGDVGDISS